VESGNDHLSNGDGRGPGGDVGGEKVNGGQIGRCLDGPPDRMPAVQAGRDGDAVPKGAVVPLECREDDFAFVGFVAVLQEKARHASSLLEPVRSRHRSITLRGTPEISGSCARWPATKGAWRERSGVVFIGPVGPLDHSGNFCSRGDIQFVEHVP